MGSGISALAPPSESPATPPSGRSTFSTRSGLSNGTRRSAPPPMIARRSGRQAPSDKMARLMRTTGKPLIIGVALGVGAFVLIRFVLFGH